MQPLLPYRGGGTLRGEQVRAEDASKIGIRLESRRRDLGRDVRVVVAILLAEVLDVRELARDRLAETLFSLICRRDARLDVDDEDLACAADCFGQAPRREAPALHVVRRDVAQLDIRVDRRVDAEHRHAGVDRRLDRSDHALAIVRRHHDRIRRRSARPH